jgi:hypothetical protein
VGTWSRAAVVPLPRPATVASGRRRVGGERRPEHETDLVGGQRHGRADDLGADRHGPRREDVRPEVEFVVAVAGSAQLEASGVRVADLHANRRRRRTRAHPEPEPVAAPTRRPDGERHRGAAARRLESHGTSAPCGEVVVAGERAAARQRDVLGLSLRGRVARRGRKVVVEADRAAEVGRSVLVPAEALDVDRPRAAEAGGVDARSRSRVVDQPVLGAVR